MKTTILFLFIGFRFIINKSSFNKIDHAGTFTGVPNKKSGRRSKNKRHHYTGYPPWSGIHFF
jgi:hypothetical protein